MNHNPDPKTTKDRTLSVLMTVSLLTGFFMLGIKTFAYFITHSTAILSDAAESVVHVVAVSFAFYSLRLTHKRSNKSYQYGYDKITFFSAGFEGAMISLAAIVIISVAVEKIVVGPVLEDIGLGTGISGLVVLINGVLGFTLVHFGKKHGSLIVEADGRHVLTDSVSSLGVLIGLLLCIFAKNPWFSSLYFDPIFAILVGLNILKSGFELLTRSVQGLMDRIPITDQQDIESILTNACNARDVLMHELRIRNSGTHYWIQFHLVFKQNILLQDAHKIATEIEGILEAAVPGAITTSHLETQTDHDLVHSSASYSGSHPS